MSDTTEWGEWDIPTGEERSTRLGSLWLAARRTASDLWLYSGHGDDPVADDDPPSSRWGQAHDATVRLDPRTPTRLLVVTPEHPFHLLPRARARLYVRIPLSVLVTLIPENAPETVALDLPSTVLSDTWWGTFTEGELAFWLPTTARASVSSDLFAPHLAMCPFQLENATDTALPIDHFAVRAPHLSLFQEGHDIWTDEVLVRYEGVEEGSEISFGGRPPAEAAGSSRLAAPRLLPPRSFRARTFDKLKSLSPLGF